AVGTVLALELESLLALSRGDQAAAEKLAREAAADEDGMSFEFGPPVVVKPAHELLGEVLLAVGKPSDAATEFQTSLAHNLAPSRRPHPGGPLARAGVGRARAGGGDRGGGRETSAGRGGQGGGADADAPGRGGAGAGGGG